MQRREASDSAGAALRASPGTQGLTLHALLRCRHAFGDQYRATDMVLEQPGKLELVFTPKDGSAAKHFEVYDFKGSGARRGLRGSAVGTAGTASAVLYQ